MSNQSTIHQTFKAMELEEQQRMDDCVAAIKKIHATGLDILVNPPRRGPRGAGNVAKYSPSGNFIGWYRENQKSGLPSRLMPIEQEMKKLFQQYKKLVISAFPKSVTASIIGTRSGKVRKERGLFDQIVNLQQQLMHEGKPKHQRPKLIAKALDCNPEFVRRTLRKINNTK
jgi:hypothetical protein